MRDGGLADFDAAGGDGLSVDFLADGDAARGIVDAEDFALAGESCEFADGAASAAADVEDREVGSDGDVGEAPIGELEVGLVHTPKCESAEPAARLLALRDGCGGSRDGCAPSADRILIVTMQFESSPSSVQSAVRLVVF